MGLVPTRFGLLGFVTVSVACMPDMREDGFPHRLASICSTQVGCERALVEAASRRASCTESAHREEACEAAKLDHERLQALAQRFRDADNAREMARHKAQQAEERATALAEETARRAREEAARLEVAARNAHIQRGRSGLQECQGTANMAACAFEGASEAERAACESDCTIAGHARADALYLSLLRQCARDGAENPRAAKCAFTGTPWAPVDREPECSKRCTVVAAKLRGYYATHAMCCDGSRSPSCTYGDLRRGCCSHHGGVCEEPEPDVE